MKPWFVRLASRRARVQWQLIAVVLLVSILSATLLTTLYLLAHATEHVAARQALVGADPADVRVVHIVRPAGTLDAILTGSQAAIDDLGPETTWDRSVEATSDLLTFPREDDSNALMYLTSSDAYEGAVDLLTGEWPVPGASPSQVLVPPRVIIDLDVEVGDVIDLAGAQTPSISGSVEIVGTYGPVDLGSDAWRFDRFDGEGYDPNTPVPGTSGFVTTDGYGPLITEPAAVEAFPLGQVVVSYTPDFADATLGEVRGLLERADTIDAVTQREIGAAAQSVSLVTTISQPLGAVVGSLAITRSSVLVTGLLLLVLAVAALGQTARLMAERRHGEQHLMIARGASGRQMLRLGTIEAIVLGALTTAAAVPLARVAYLQLDRVPALRTSGLIAEPGWPWEAWAVAGIMGLALTVVLIAPLLRRTGTFVDAEQGRSRPGKRAAFQRSGLDVAALVLAALAYWQLRSYESPVLTEDAIARVDPLLAAGPALALLAGGLLAVRLIPAASRVLEAVAARGRRAVSPLAAWEVGRRSARAVSAVLLLTLAVASGTFALSFLATWHSSQDDQALYLHPAPAEVTGLTGTPSQQRETLGAAGAEAHPTVVSSAELTSDTLLEVLQRRRDFAGRSAALVATDAGGAAFLGEGRLAQIDGDTIAAALGAVPADEGTPAALPAEAESVQLRLTAEVSAPEITDLLVIVRLLVREGDDLRSIDAGLVPGDGMEHVVTAPLGGEAAASAVPRELVGIQAVWLATDQTARGQTGLGNADLVEMDLSVASIDAVLDSTTLPVPRVPPTLTTAPVDIDFASWDLAAQFGSARAREVDEEVVARLTIASTPGLLRFRTVTVAATTMPGTGDLPLVMTEGLAQTLRMETSEVGTARFDNIIVPFELAATVPQVGGETLDRPTIVVDLAQWQVAMFQRGGAVNEVDRWWSAEQLAQADLVDPGEDAAVTTRAGVADDLRLDPLRIAIQAALWIVAGAAIALSAVGFAVHIVVTVRARLIEFAQLRAVGLGRGQLVRVVATESLLLSVVGVAFGLAVGLALSYLVAPLVSVGPDGRPPVPAVVVDVPWIGVGLLGAQVLAVFALALVLVSGLVRGIDPAKVLRMGDER